MTHPTREGRTAAGQPVWRVEVVDEWAIASDSDQLRTTDEPLGTKEKFWVYAPDDSRYLFKYARVHTDGRTMGEDWVAGRDRHHENWAAIDRAGKLELAPSFDHGNALGFQECEERIRELADSEESLARWARRGRSHHFCDALRAGKPALVHLASMALELTGPGVREHWLDALAAVTSADIEAVLGSVPPRYLSEVGRTFRAKLLHHNQERILHGD